MVPEAGTQLLMMNAGGTYFGAQVGSVKGPF